MSKFVLTPMSKVELSRFFDDDALKVIQFFLKKSIVSQPEKIPSQEDLPIQIPKEHIEQWIVQALGVKPIGAGSYPVDVIASNWGADVKMLSCKLDKNGNLKNADSGETSLAQKFGDGNFGDGNTLDDLFSQGRREFIWSKWQDILVEKYKKVESDHNITDIYYFIVLRADSVFHLCGLKVDLSKLGNTIVNENRSTKDSIWIKNFIEDDYGHIKVYKAKKRLELRLKPKKWVEDNMVISFDTNFDQVSANIREKIANNELDDYIDDVLVPIINQ
jgi:hypothetical protein